MLWISLPAANATAMRRWRPGGSRFRRRGAEGAQKPGNGVFGGGMAMSRHMCAALCICIVLFLCRDGET